uniref:Uncharacterized protein n=1 Tax=Anguilla anguilla TaxID=7936 RepID=A0A0E9X4V7_ANGAN
MNKGGGGVLVEFGASALAVCSVSSTLDFWSVVLSLLLGVGEGVVGEDTSDKHASIYN